MNMPPSTPPPEPPAVDVIMRTRDRPDLLPRAIDSLRRQTSREWHLILVDNGDHGATAKWLRDNPGNPGERITHLHVPHGPMIGALSNTGIRAGRSPYITQLDDDDTWDPRFLEVSLESIRAHAGDPDVGGVVARTAIVREAWNGSTWQTLETETLNATLKRLTLPALASVNRFTVNALLYRREVWEKLGGYDESLPVLDDWDFNLRFLCEYDIEVIPECLANWHWRAAKPDAPISGARADHEFHTARIINREIRRKMRGERAPLADLFIAGELHRLDGDAVKRLYGKLKSMSTKIGRIDARTKRGD